MVSNNKAEVVVVGGGSTGASIAFNLARRGLKKIMLLERNSLSSGSTGKSSAIIRTHYSNPITVKIASESLRFFQHFEDVVEGSCDFRKTGFLVCVGADSKGTIESNVRMQRELGIKTSLLTQRELKELEPRMHVEDLEIAAYEPESGYADPTTTTNSLVRAAQKHGTVVCQRAELRKIKVTRGAVESIITDKGEVVTPKVVLACGVWTKKISAQIGLDIPIRATRHQLWLFVRPEDFGDPHPIVIDFVGGIYLRPEVGSQTWVGSVSDNNAESVENPDSYKEGADHRVMVEFTERFVHRFPKMEAGNVVRGYSGLYDTTPDWHPILDSVPITEGLYIAAGFSGHGFKLCPAVGRIISELVVDGKSEDARFFRLSRFEERMPFPPGYKSGVLA